jgi:hypothetical protein
MVKRLTEPVIEHYYDIQGLGGKLSGQITKGSRISIGAVQLGRYGVMSR